MQEPPRLNLLNILQKSLKLSEKKTYIHRIIYIGDFTFTRYQDARILQLAFESNIKLINDEYPDTPLTGFSLFYDGYFITIIEGSEEGIARHLRTLYDSLTQNATNCPNVKRMKVLIVAHHIVKRNFFTWFGRPATPPVLLDKIEATTDPEDTLRQIHICIKKVYRMSEYLRNQPVGLIRATIDNISEVCQQYLPEVNLLDFLLDCPALLPVQKYLEKFATVPEITNVSEVIWPLPTDYVPYHILDGDDKAKVLLYAPRYEEQTEPEKERVEEPEALPTVEQEISQGIENY